MLPEHHELLRPKEEKIKQVLITLNTVLMDFGSRDKNLTITTIDFKLTKYTNNFTNTVVLVCYASMYTSPHSTL